MKTGQLGMMTTVVIAFAALAALVLTGQAGIRKDLRAVQADLLAGQAELRKEMQAGQAELRKDMRTGQAELRKDMQAGQAELREDMRAGQAELRKDVRAGQAELRKDMRKTGGLQAELRKDVRRRGRPSCGRDRSRCGRIWECSAAGSRSWSIARTRSKPVPGPWSGERPSCSPAPLRPPPAPIPSLRRPRRPMLRERRSPDDAHGRGRPLTVP